MEGGDEPVRRGDKLGAGEGWHCSLDVLGWRWFDLEIGKSVSGGDCKTKRKTRFSRLYQFQCLLVGAQH